METDMKLVSRGSIMFHLNLYHGQTT